MLSPRLVLEKRDLVQTCRLLRRCFLKRVALAALNKSRCNLQLHAAFFLPPCCLILPHARALRRPLCPTWLSSDSGSVPWLKVDQPLWLCIAEQMQDVAEKTCSVFPLRLSLPGTRLWHHYITAVVILSFFVFLFSLDLVTSLQLCTTVLFILLIISD